MTEITVYHISIPGVGEKSVFIGESMEYRMDSDGSLRVLRFVTGAQMGDALFAPGQWTYVCRSK